MSITKAIYKLGAILDNPKYEGFAIDEEPSLLGHSFRCQDLDWNFDVKLGEWVAPRFSETWIPLRVLGRVRPFNDFPCLALSYPVFSQRAIDVLRDILEPNGELLPLDTNIGSYFLYNCMTVADIIDFKQSKLSYINKHTVSEIYNLEIHPDKLIGLTIFQMKNHPGTCFIADSVALRIREARLEGFELRKVWPLPKHVYYMMHRKHPECHDELTAQPSPEIRPIKGNTVVLRLELSGEHPSPEERSHFEAIADNLDAMLVDPSNNANYFGNLEITEFVPWEARYFFSCPDANALADKLNLWLKTLEWPGKKYLMKRFGGFKNDKAAEEYVNII